MNKAARKEARRARAPELKTKYPPSTHKGRGDFGIQFEYNLLRWVRRIKWYGTERGREQALARMLRRPIYKNVKKVSR